jgi:hypothetical protein
MFTNLKLRMALGQARNSGDPARLVRFLKMYPQETTAVAKAASGDLQQNAPWHALVLCVSLARVDADSTTTVLEQMFENENLRRIPDAWNRLNPAGVNALLGHLERKGRSQTRLRLVSCLNDEQIAGVLRGPEQPDFLELIELFLSDNRLPMVARAQELILQAVYKIGGSPATGTYPVLRVSLLAAVRMLRWGRVDESLPVFAAIDAQDSRLMRKAVLRKLAGQLSTISMNSLVRVARLMDSHPSDEWLRSLCDVWLSIEDQARRKGEQEVHDLPAVLEEAGNAVASAMGACAAKDPSYLNFAGDERQAPGLSEMERQLQLLIDKHNSLVKQYQHQYVASRSKQTPSIDRLVSEIDGLKHEIEEMEEEVDALRLAHRRSLSAGYLLLCVLHAAQAYPIGLRQGAAWGLHVLANCGHLDPVTKDQIHAVIRECVTDDNNQIFCERRLHFLPHLGPAERLHCIRQALHWMSEIVEFHQAGDDSTPQDGEFLEAYGRLPQILGLIHRLLPEAERFLGKYPLRLMPLKRHKHILGNYFRSRCGLTHWTSYIPPVNIGEVRSRYLVVDDRSTPNSMGIYYKLFRHPLLALPVIYHEFLHYGGTLGDPRNAIENETEVLIRETLFARSLIAKLAPDDDKDIPAFEQDLAEEIWAADLESLLLQLGCKLEHDNHLEWINRTVIDTYGEQKSDADAASEAAIKAEMENALIVLENRLQIWHPEVPWPLLGADETRHVSQEFTRIMKQSFMRDHRVIPSRRDQILNDTACSGHLREWEKYCHRQYSLSKLHVTWPSDDAELATIFLLIVRRFEIETKSDDILRTILLRQFSNATATGHKKD